MRKLALFLTISLFFILFICTHAKRELVSKAQNGTTTHQLKNNIPPLKQKNIDAKSKINLVRQKNSQKQSQKGQVNKQNRDKIQQIKPIESSITNDQSNFTKNKDLVGQEKKKNQSQNENYKPQLQEKSKQEQVVSLFTKNKQFQNTNPQMSTSQQTNTKTIDDYTNFFSSEKINNTQQQSHININKSIKKEVQNQTEMQKISKTSQIVNFQNNKPKISRKLDESNNNTLNQSKIDDKSKVKENNTIQEFNKDNSQTQNFVQQLVVNKEKHQQIVSNQSKKQENLSFVHKNQQNQSGKSIIQGQNANNSNQFQEKLKAILVEAKKIETYVSRFKINDKESSNFSNAKINVNKNLPNSTQLQSDTKTKNNSNNFVNQVKLNNDQQKNLTNRDQTIEKKVETIPEKQELSKQSLIIDFQTGKPKNTPMITDPATGVDAKNQTKSIKIKDNNIINQSKIENTSIVEQNNTIQKSKDNSSTLISVQQQVENKNSQQITLNSSKKQESIAFQDNKLQNKTIQSMNQDQNANKGNQSQEKSGTIQVQAKTIASHPINTSNFVQDNVTSNSSNQINAIQLQNNKLKVDVLNKTNININNISNVIIDKTKIVQTSNSSSLASNEKQKEQSPEALKKKINKLLQQLAYLNNSTVNINLVEMNKSKKTKAIPIFQNDTQQQEIHNLIGPKNFQISEQKQIDNNHTNEIGSLLPVLTQQNNSKKPIKIKEIMKQQENIQQNKSTKIFNQQKLNGTQQQNKTLHLDSNVIQKIVNISQPILHQKFEKQQQTKNNSDKQQTIEEQNKTLISNAQQSNKIIKNQNKQPEKTQANKKLINMKQFNLTDITQSEIATRFQAQKAKSINQQQNKGQKDNMNTTFQQSQGQPITQKMQQKNFQSNNSIQNIQNKVKNLNSTHNPTSKIDHTKQNKENKIQQQISNMQTNATTNVKNPQSKKNSKRSKNQQKKILKKQGSLNQQKPIKHSKKTLKNNQIIPKTDKKEKKQINQDNNIDQKVVSTVKSNIMINQQNFKKTIPVQAQKDITNLKQDTKQRQGKQPKNKQLSIQKQKRQRQSLLHKQKKNKLTLDSVKTKQQLFKASLLPKDKNSNIKDTKTLTKSSQLSQEIQNLNRQIGYQKKSHNLQDNNQQKKTNQADSTIDLLWMLLYLGIILAIIIIFMRICKTSKSSSFSQGSSQQLFENQWSGIEVAERLQDS